VIILVVEFSICGGNLRWKLDLFIFHETTTLQVKEMDLDNIEIYQPLTFDIICAYSLSFPKYKGVFKK